MMRPGLDTFVISGSTDGSVYTNVYSGKSKGTTKAIDVADSSARYASADRFIKSTEHDSPGK